MQTTRLIAPGLLAVVLSTGCGKSNDSSSDGSTATTGEVASYQQLALQVQDSARSYQTTMMTPAVKATADCQRLHDQYDAQVRPWVSQMVQMGASMDRYMSAHGGGNVADYACVSMTMMDELDRHRSVACTLANLGADQVEVGRHVDAMLSYGGHMWDRCDQIRIGTDTGSWSWEPMMGGCEAWDGHCSDMMYDNCSSGMMHGMRGGCCD